jgi:gamma-glutamyltranspeptidase/glutathione hydrolase
VQVTSRIADFGQNPQATSDAPRWRVMDDNSTLAVEWNFPPDVVEGLRAMGHKVVVAPRFDTEFGCAQLALRSSNGGYIAASDHRKDGYPVGM